MKLNIKIFSLSLLFVGFLASSCEIEPIENPNAPSIESFENGATLSELGLLANGVASAMRNDMEFYFNTVSIIGREYFDLNGSDPRYTGELLGTSVLDPNGFLTTRAFAASYRTIRTAQILLNALPNSISEASLTDEQAAAIRGYANTMIAYQRLLLLNRQFENGIRLDVVDPENLGPFVSYDEAMGAVASQLDEAAVSLTGASMPFDISSGFSLGGDPAGDLLKINRALAARVALYQGNNSKAKGLIQDSFLESDFTDIDVADLGLDEGAYYVFGAGGGDILNPLFNVEGVNLYAANPAWVEEAEEGDTRLSKVKELDADISIGGISSPYFVQVFNSNTDPVPIIRKEELILICAEASIGTNNDMAIAAINKIREAAGLEDYAGGTSDSELLDEVLRQRRYSLFGEGHRWIDMRRTGNLDKIDPIIGEIHRQFPTPVAEGL